MRLARARFRNFRCYSAEVSLDIGGFTALIGKNDSGKSSVLEALSIFFDEKAAPDSDDASIGGDSNDVRIICEFDHLPESLVLDAGYETTLAAEHLLNADGRLEIHKIYDCSLKKPKLAATVARALHPAQEGMNDLLMLKNKELKGRAQELGVGTDDIDTKVNSHLRQKIWASADAPEMNEVEIPLDAENTRKIWEQLKKRLPLFALFKADRPSTDQDAEAQDPMKAAIKEAFKQKEEELGEIAKHVEREVKSIANRTIEKLREMDPELASQLNPRLSTPSWSNVFKVTLTGDEEIPINKRGSGVRRLILINFFRARAEQQASGRDDAGIIYAVEEPETSQHPDNQKMLMYALSELAEQQNCQVVVTTHTPNLGRLLPVDSLRYVASDGDGGRVVHSGDDETCRLVANGLGILPDHDVKLFIGVEGINDIFFLRTVSAMLRNAGEDVPDLTGLEENDEIIFIPCGGSNLGLWASRLAGLNRPEFHLFDRDSEPPEESPHQGTVDAINERESCVAVLTAKREMENYLHADAIAAVREEVVLEITDFGDVPALTAEAVHEASEADKPWAELDERKQSKKQSRAKRWLNYDAVAAMTPALLTNRDPNGEVRGWLEEVRKLLGP